MTTDKQYKFENAAGNVTLLTSDEIDMLLREPEPFKLWAADRDALEERRRIEDRIAGERLPL